jgi:hypothetical protein
MSTNQILTPHFTLQEMTESLTAKKHGIANVPPPEAVENLRKLCIGTLEPLREKLKQPVVITSGFRCQQLNEIIVHASRKSQHMSGQAADFYVVSGSKIQDSGQASHRELLIKAFRLIITDESIDFDQLILYPNFIHVSYVSKERNRRKITKANGQGTYCALSRAQALNLQ